MLFRSALQYFFSRARHEWFINQARCNLLYLSDANRDLLTCLLPLLQHSAKKLIKFMIITILTILVSLSSPNERMSRSMATSSVLTRMGSNKHNVGSL